MLKQVISVFDNTEFDEIIMKFTDQNGRPLKIEDKVNLKLLINKTETGLDYATTASKNST